MQPTAHIKSWRREAIRYVVQAILLFALLVAIFPGTFLRGETIFPGDLLFLNRPWNAYAPEGFTQPANPIMSDVVVAFHVYYVLVKQALAHGEWPLWNPYEMGGIPLLANFQSAVFYPPRLLFAVLGIWDATTLYVLFKLWLCGMVAYGCARVLRLGPMAASFFSLAWMLSSYNVIWAEWSLTDVAAWFPVAFVGAERIAGGRFRTGAAALGVGGTLLLLAGHPETSFTFGLGVSLYLLVRLTQIGRGVRHAMKALVVYGGTWVVVFAVASVQLLPFIEYLNHSATTVDRTPIRDLGWYYSPGMVVGFWIPSFFGNVVNGSLWAIKTHTNLLPMLYPSIAVWIGAVLAFRRTGVRRVQRTRALALAIAGGCTLAVSFQVPPLAYIDQLPLLASTNDAYYSVFALFALPLLAAIGFDAWFRTRRTLRGLVPVAVLIGVATLVVVAVYHFYAPLMRMSRMSGYVNTNIAVTVGLAIVIGGLVLMNTFRPRRNLWLILIAAVMAGDLLYAARQRNVTMNADEIYPDTKLTTFLQEQKQPVRFGLGEAHVASGSMAHYGIAEWLAYDGIYPERPWTFQRELGPKVWNIMEPVYGVEYYCNYVGEEPSFPVDDPGRFTLVGTYDGIEVYKNNWAFPRAFLLGDSRIMPDKDSLFALMKNRPLDPRKQALMLADEAPRNLPPPSDDPGAAEVARYAMTQVDVDVDAAAPAVLVLGDTYYPGWEARVDGTPTKIFPVFYMFRGIVVPAGHHRVEYVYRPFSFRLGLAISTVALIALGGIALWLLLRRSRKKQPA